MDTRLLRASCTVQKKELVLAKLRHELLITDQRHASLRKMIEEETDLTGRYIDASLSSMARASFTD